MLAIVPFIPVPATSSYTNTLAVLHHLKFMDESSVNTSMTRPYGSHPSHLRVIDKVPRLSGPNTTTLAVLDLEGIVAPLVIKGAVNGATFYGYTDGPLYDRKVDAADRWPLERPLTVCRSKTHARRHPFY